ncbi:hypothetical protein C8Q74DRAFT_289883 [Fomes fomentarius]|nr:hypothetical protein C8Q74DRAFT_289883 [Fomes fomentarius]
MHPYTYTAISEYLPASGWVSDTHSTISVDGTTHSPTTNDSTATLNFTGTGFEVVALAPEALDTDQIVVACQVDDLLYLILPDPLPSTYPANLTWCATRDLPAGSHTLTLETNPGALNQAFLFDYVRIFGEEASNTSAPTSSPTPSGSTSTSTSTSTSEPSPTNSSAPQHVPIGPVVGGAVGGGIALALIAFALAFFLLRRKRKRESSPEDQISHYWGGIRPSDGHHTTQTEVRVAPTGETIMSPASSASRTKGASLVSSKTSSAGGAAQHPSGHPSEPARSSEPVAQVVVLAEDSGWRERTEPVVLPPPYTVE